MFSGSFYSQVVQAGRSFVFFCRTSREKLDLLRALSDGFVDMVVLIIMMIMTLMMQMIVMIIYVV